MEEQNFYNPAIVMPPPSVVDGALRQWFQQPRTTLTDDDYRALERSFITRDIADAAGIYRVASLDGAELTGRKHGDCAGIVFPYRWPGDRHKTLERLRLDNPPLGSDGKPEHKYLSAPGARNRLYLPPCDPALTAEANVPVVITEGEKKTLALWRMASETGNSGGVPAFLPMGLAGVWCWRGNIGIRTNAKGERVSEKGVLPDFDRIAWQGRKVTILFDANVATNESVRAARRELARELTRRGAKVLLVDLPQAVGINGCDDYLHMFGVANLAQVLNQAVPYEWRKGLITTENGKIRPLLANAITALQAAPEWSGVLAYDEFSLCPTTLQETHPGDNLESGRNRTTDYWPIGSSVTEFACPTWRRAKRWKRWRGSASTTQCGLISNRVTGMEFLASTSG